MGRRIFDKISSEFLLVVIVNDANVVAFLFSVLQS